VQQGMLGGDGDLVSLDGGAVGVDDDFAFRPDLVPDPAHPDLAGAQHAGGGAQGVFGLVDELEVDGVHQPPVDLACCLPQDGEDGDSDEETDDGVGPAPADRNAACAGQHGQGGQSVGAGVEPVRDQGGGADLPFGADPVPCDQLVAGEPEHGRGGHGGEVGDVPGCRSRVTAS
jgi:hypothetical protein